MPGTARARASWRALIVAAAVVFLGAIFSAPASAVNGWGPLPDDRRTWSCAPIVRPDSNSWVRACVVVNANGHAQAWAVVGNNNGAGSLTVREASVNLHDEPNGSVISHGECGVDSLVPNTYKGCPNTTVDPDCGGDVYGKVSVYLLGQWWNPPPASKFVPC